MPSGNNIVGEVNLLVKPLDPNGQFNAGVNSIIKKLEQQAQFQIRASGLDEVQQGANGIGQGFAKASLEAAGLTAAIYGIKAGIEGAIAKFSNLFDQLAQAKAGFTSILHSEAAGGALLDDIREFARVSPFVTQELVNYSQQLLGVGLTAKKIIPLLKSTGDIISAVGGDTRNLGRVLFTLTQIKSIGLLKGQDTMQLQNSLIPITKYLSEYLHKSTQEIVKLREAGQITADTVFNALNQQGEKVKGAMDKATRNIVGARAILSDTITQLFQDQPVLNKIFIDIYTSIQKLADKVGEAKFQQAFAQFFDGVDKVYQGLKPLLSELAKIGGSGAITSMKLLGTVLGEVGSALNAIPEVAIKVFAQFLVALGTVKAPLLLLRYVATIRTLVTALIPATGAFGAATVSQANLGIAVENSARKYVLQTEAVGQNTAALDANQRAMMGRQWAIQQLNNKQLAILNQNAVGPIQANPMPEDPDVLGGLGGGDDVHAWSKTREAFVTKAKNAIKARAAVGAALLATIGGQLLQEIDNVAAKSAGGALTGAGTGALLGSFLGPEGSLVGLGVGAAAGGLFGGITSYLSATEEKAKKHLEKMKALGAEAAAAFILAEQSQFGTAATAPKFTHRADEIRDLQEQLFEAQHPKSTKAHVVEGGATYGLARRLGKDPSVAVDKGKVAQLTQQHDDLVKAQAAETDQIVNNIATVTAGLDQESKALIGLTNAGKGKIRVDFLDEIKDVGKTAVNLDRAQKILEKYNLNIADLGDPDNLENVAGIIRAFEGLTTAEEQATIAANKYNEALKDAKTVAAAIYGPLETKIENQIASLGVKKAQLDAAVAAGQDPNDPVKQLTSQDANFKAEADARAAQILLDKTKLDNLKAKQAADIGKTGFSNITADTIAALNNAHAWKESTVAVIARTRGEAELAAALLATRTLETANTTYHITQLEKLAGVVDNVQNRSIVIKVNTDAVQKVLQTLEILNDTREEADKRANARGAPSTFDADVAVQKRNLALLAGSTPITPREVQYVKDYTEALQLAFAAEKRLLGPLEDFIGRYTAQKSLDSLFGNLFEVMEDNAVRLNDSLSNVEEVVFGIAQASQAIRVTKVGEGVSEIDAQTAADKALWTQLELLQATLGYTDEKFGALLDKLGITEPKVDGITTNFGDLSKSLGISKDKLAEFLGYLGLVTDPKTIVISVDILQALEELAKLEKLVPNFAGSHGTYGATSALQAKIDQMIKDAGGTVGVTPDIPGVGKGDKAKEVVDHTQDAIDALTRRLEEAARAIADAADKWVGSIKERTQYEASVTARKATRNADRQTKDLTEITTGLTTLKGRGLSDEAISSLSIDNVNDLKQVRKLLKASPTEIAQLSTAVANLETKSTEIATTQEDKRTRQNITEGILEAAKTLEIDFTKTDAATLGGQFTINTTTNAEDVATAIINALRSGATTH